MYASTPLRTKLSCRPTQGRDNHDLHALRVHTSTAALTTYKEQTYIHITTCRANDYPFVYDGSLQLLLKGCAPKVHRRSGVVTSFRLKNYEVSDVKHYEERFANGPDLHDRGYEQPLSRSDIRAFGH